MPIQRGRHEWDDNFTIISNDLAARRAAIIQSQGTPGLHRITHH